MEFSTIADILGIIGFLITIISIVFSFRAWFQSRKVNQRLDAEEKRLNQPITIILKCGEKIQTLPVTVQRKFFTRAEVLGLLGMIKPGARMNFLLSRKEFFEDLDTIVNGTEPMSLTIELTNAEYEELYGKGNQP